MKATYTTSRELANGIFSYLFKPERKIDQIAGQYTELTIKHAGTDSRGDKRWFTIASRPGSEEIDIITRNDPKTTVSSFKMALRELTPGTIVDIADPMGDFVLPIDKSRNLLFIAGGIGITPYLSILDELKNNKDKRFINLIYAFRNKDDQIDLSPYTGELAKLELLSDSDLSENEKLSTELVFTRYQQLKDPLIYIAGPEPMVESFTKDLISKGVDRNDIVSDYFSGYVN